jgi:hypothetical protein
MSKCAVNCFRALLRSDNNQARLCMNTVVSALLISLLEAQADNLSFRVHLSIFADILQSDVGEGGKRSLPCNGADWLALPLLLVILKILSQTAGRPDSEAASTMSSALPLATTRPTIFKEALSRLPTLERETIEAGLRLALKEKEQTGALEPVRPAISLKSEFALGE